NSEPSKNSASGGTDRQTFLRHSNLQPSSCARSASNIERSTNAFEPFAHADQAESLARHGVPIEPGPVVGDRENQLPVRADEFDRDIVRLTVLDDVLQGFLGNTKQAECHVSGKQGRNVAVLESHREAGE